MKYLLSMDGGGSKTAWLLTDEAGNMAAHFVSEGCSHLDKGVPAVLTLIHDGIDILLMKTGISKSDLLSAVFGVPCYGEHPEADRCITNDLKHYLSPVPVMICNDVDLGFAGSLCLDKGIHLVAGTGAIATGRNAAGLTARSNGWHPAFSDEGSGYWLGMHTLSLFSKQADRRIPRSSLYSIVRRELSLKKDEDLITYYENFLSGDRKKIAALQLLLKEAALSGDASALRLYEEAACELYQSVCGIYQALSFSPEDRIKISYSGGLFHEGSLILPTLTQLTEKLCARLVPPALSPVWGGILLAMEQISPSDAQNLANRLTKESANKN